MTVLRTNIVRYSVAQNNLFCIEGGDCRVYLNIFKTVLLHINGIPMVHGKYATGILLENPVLGHTPTSVITKINSGQKSN